MFILNIITPSSPCLQYNKVETLAYGSRGASQFNSTVLSSLVK